MNDNHQDKEQQLEEDALEDKRSAISIGFAWGYRLMSLSLVVALTAFLGHWLDNRWNTSPVLLIVGVFLGLTTFFVQLLAMIQGRNTNNTSGR